MRVNPNYSDAFEQIAPGQHKAKIKSAEVRTSQNNNRYIRWELTIQTAQPNSKTIFHNTMLEGKGSGMLKQFIKCVMGDEYDDGSFDTEDLVGRSLLVDLQYEKVEYKGQMKEFLRVKQVERLTVMNEPQPFEDDIAF